MFKRTTAIVLLAANTLFTNAYSDTKKNIDNNNGTVAFKTAYSPILKKIKEDGEKTQKRIQDELKQKAIQAEQKRKDNVRVYMDDVTIKSNITVNELNAVFDNIGQPQMKEFSNIIISCEQEYDINAFFLTALIAHESGWTKLPNGLNKTNLTGYTVYNSSSYGRSFTSKNECIKKTADLLRNDYLNIGGQYYNGVSVYDVNVKYCLYDDMKTTDYHWSEDIVNIQNHLESVYQHKIKSL